jgi:hypothetical protein
LYGHHKSSRLAGFILLGRLFFIAANDLYPDPSTITVRSRDEAGGSCANTRYASAYTGKRRHSRAHWHSGKSG